MWLGLTPGREGQQHGVKKLRGKKRERFSFPLGQRKLRIGGSPTDIEERNGGVVE